MKATMKTTMKNLVSFILLFFAVFFVAGSQANAQDYYYIVAKHSGKCLHQHGGTQGNGDPITQWDCVNEPNVLWQLRPAPN
jgi:hypothetical protein